MKCLFTGYYPHLHGGLERFVERTKKLLEENGHVVTLAGDPPLDASEYDLVLMNKIPPSVELLKRLKAQCGSRLRFYAHDHESYCLRRHYYDPFRRNCNRSYSAFPCRFCAAVTRPSWIPRALTRDLPAFRDELREVKSFAPSTYIERNLRREGFTEVTTLYPLFTEPLAESRRDFMPEGKLRLLFMGQLIAGKGVAVLLDAVRKMKSPHSLTVVGTGKDEAKLRARADSSVTFTGWMDNAAENFARHDVTVLPSLWNEPFGTVGAESIAHATPVVGFDVGGISDWLVDGHTGYFASAVNVEALAAALDRAADARTLEKFSVADIAKTRELFSPKHFLEALA